MMLRHLLSIGWLLALVSPAASAQAANGDAAGRRITVGVLELKARAGDSSAASSSRGVTLGLEEAERTARLFGWEVVALRAPDSLTEREAMRFLTRAGVTAIVANLTGALQPDSRSAPLVLEIGKHAGRSINPCGDAEFHLLPRVDSSSANLVAWDPSLERFGAAQLNDRYRRRFNDEMDERAWAGWMSVKILVDAVLRLGNKDPCALERFLLGANASFDGHKGVPLSFDSDTRELVQPLFQPRLSGEPVTVLARNRPDTTQVRHRAGTLACLASC
jgi:hypothetical protein